MMQFAALASASRSVVRGRAPPASSLPAWTQALALWEQGEIANTALSSVEPAVWPLGKNPSNKISAWNGATLRRAGSIYMLGAAGGHGDYHGNELNAIELNVEVPAWAELRGPTVDADIIKLTPVYLDGRRSAVHTYWSTQYDNINDRMLIVSSGGPHGSTPPPDPPEGWTWPVGTPVLMGFDRAANDWTAPDDLPAIPFSTGSADLCCTNGATGEIFYVKSQEGTMRKYSPTANAWSTVGSYYMNGGYRGSAIDTVRNRMLIVGDFSGSLDPVVRSTLDASAVSATFGGLGPTVLRSANYPGVVYDEENDCFLVFINTNPITIYRVDAATFEVTQPVLTGTPWAQRQNGIHNAVQYVPEMRGVALANEYAANMKFMRTAA